MSDTVIRVENLSKKYIIGHQKQERYTSLRDVIANGTKSLLHSLSGKRPDDSDDISEEFWALKDVSFEIKQGDRVGIIGRNGAGKSTLLKILSRITEPTSGKISIKGRVASLLEVGTGFHPELTGRENVYLNGAILGMDRAEIKKKFDEIVAFAEIERFLDTPVKRYSSGMYVRLAFAVAAHLEPEILIVDEVLAVGDAQFQEKCLGKMQDVTKEGRTIIFVSHNMGAIKALCQRGLYLRKGELLANDSIEKIVNCYFDSGQVYSLDYFCPEIRERPYIKTIRISQQDNLQNNNFNIDKSITIYIEFESYGKNEIVTCIAVRNQQGLLVHHSSDEFMTEKTSIGDIRKCIIPAYGLSASKYYVDVSIAQRNYEILDQVFDFLCFEVEFTGIGSDKTTANDWKGVCGPGLLMWH
ncbi:ATP-binding cassette domain-containing protein [Pseudanabaena sp. FACHB-1998]|uniref:ABC transporter ATP-binding protein n=1 Tax=Pseudanabaena sp. FACHB-1998 TaxID=2692858 RepID=UPI00168096F2|nr:polysaccharide ABC transporter ATP-binding protein [Pseudanabaena sp. FACHB-1998]MBD2176646.1 ATP-binding cassette domain-containing protein [Pseudanabaena sp. FACHB-1998]